MVFHWRDWQLRAGDEEDLDNRGTSIDPTFLEDCGLNNGESADDERDEEIWVCEDSSDVRIRKRPSSRSRPKPPSRYQKASQWASIARQHPSVPLESRLLDADEERILMIS